MAQRLYTPFLSQAGAAIGRGLEARGLQQQEREKNRLIQSAYMGQPGAMEQLYGVDPQAAANLEAQKSQQEQRKLKTAQTAEEMERSEAERMRQLYGENKELMDQSLKEASKMDTLEQAQAHLDSVIQQNPELFEGMRTTPLTEERLAQLKKLYGDDIEERRQRVREAELEMDIEKESRLAGKLSSSMEKLLDASQTAALEGNNKANQYQLLADDIEQQQADFGDVGGGVGSTFSENVKRFTGDQEGISDLRRRFNAVRISSSLQNLPPGPATDKDVELALKGVPPENANPEIMVSFLRGMAKLEYLDSQYNRLKSSLIAEKGNTRGLIDKWQETAESLDLSPYSSTFARKKEEKPKEKPAPSPVAKPAPSAPKTGDVVQGYKFLGGDPSNPESWEKQ
jgi:hypothetical protein